MAVPSPNFVPEFAVEINGEPIPAALRASISGVSYETGLEGADRVELTLVNENRRWLDHPLLALDGRLTLSIGYAGDLERLFVGQVVGHSGSFPSGGAPTLTVAAQDRMTRLQRGTKTRWFHIPAPLVDNYPLPDPLIAGAVAAENLLFPITDPVAATLGVILGGLDAVQVAAGQEVIRRQSGESDQYFLQRIARQNGWEMVIDHSDPLAGHKLRFFSPLDRLQPEVTLEYGRSLVDFDARISNVGQIVGVSVRVWVPQAKMEFTVTVSWDWERQALDLSVVPGFGLPGEELLLDEAQATAAESSVGGTMDIAGASIDLFNEPVQLASAPRKIISKLFPRLYRRQTGQGGSVGDPRIGAGTVLHLQGLGQELGGLYRVTTATHTIDGSGYVTRFQVRKEPWFATLPETGGVPLSLQGQPLRRSRNP